MYKKELNCRVCGGNLKSVLDLGEIYPSNFVDITDGTKAPLELTVCEKCNLCQLADTVNLDSMYVENYWYKSSLNPAMVDALQDIVNSAMEIFPLSQRDRVLDIGANDCTMLGMYPNYVHTTGVDPSETYKGNLEKCNSFYNNYFPIGGTFFDGEFKIITSIAMFYDLPDPTKFVEEIYRILDAKGIWIVQFTDLVSMLKTNAFDNLCHEHLEYYSVSWMKSFVKTFGLNIFDISFNNVNGRSVRLYIDKNFRETSPNVLKEITKEKEYLNSFDNPFEAFALRILEAKKKLLEFIKGKDIIILGASTKGNTLLQYYGIDSKMIHYAAEVNEDKYYKYTVGTNIKIIPEKLAIELRPEYFLILPWHFKDLFGKLLLRYLRHGGKLLVPLPHPAIAYLNLQDEVVWEEL